MQGSSSTPALTDEEFAQHAPKHHLGRESVKLRRGHSGEQASSHPSLESHLRRTPSVELSLAHQQSTLDVHPRRAMQEFSVAD